MKEQLLKGPIMCGIDASTPGFRGFTKGVYDPDQWMPRINHAIGVVGYGTDAETGKDFWWLRNSWTTCFGE